MQPPPCAQANAHNPRFGLNWAKLRAWQWAEYDALIMLDADMVVLVRADLALPVSWVHS